MIDEGTIANLSIDCVILCHTKQKKMTYQKDGLSCFCDARNIFIVNLVRSLKGNTLVLFQYVEKHGVILHSMMSHTDMGGNLHYVYGGTDTEDRESVREIVEKNKEDTILAPYGTFLQV